ncbi:uncharacterized protein LOC129766489 [Toxorhynchites rutilus septentrionalis]|uniref:uncharacterized protein LOC129766489 n=1 Tax=Toxorhynchites rutilus septentrionalis TaxID=329112 RepID=UPI00247A235D|nr:uncharacterized protein LOC129766489 [Toxorhynchites rutilus septentrionalis]
MEELSNRINYSQEEKQCEQYYSSTVSRQTDGRYVVRLPRKHNFDELLGQSKTMALHRYELLERRLLKSPELKEGYNEFMSEYISLSRTHAMYSKTNYLPHHPVTKKESTTIKLRVMFDASAKTSTGFSLNEALLVGPVIQDDLLTIILRFRIHPVAVVGDIVKMYRQILFHHEDTTLQRIVWGFKPTDPVECYELQTVTYGLSPSSFLATRTLEQLAVDEGQSHPIGALLCESPTIWTTS